MQKYRVREFKLINELLRYLGFNKKTLSQTAYSYLTFLFCFR